MALVVVLHVRDGRDAQVENVRGVEPAAQPDLDHRQVDLAPGKLAHRGGGERLELGRRTEPRGDGIDRRQHPRDRCGEPPLRDRRAVDRDPLAIAHEVRLRHRAGAQPGRAQGGACKRDDAALAVRARDERAPQSGLRAPELIEDGSDALEPEAHAEPAAGCERVDRLGVVHRSSLGYDSSS